MIRVLFALFAAILAIGGARPSFAMVPPSQFGYDAHSALDVRVAKTWREGTSTVREVTFASTHGTRIHARIVLPSGSAPHPGVLFVHWLGNVSTTNLTEFAPDARSLAERGITSVLIDAMWAAPDWFDKVRAPDTDYADSIKQVIDMRRSLDLLLAQPNVDPKRIAFVGHDFGAMYGAVLSGIDPRPKYYVFMAGTTSFSEWYLLGSAPKDKPAYVEQMRGLDPIPFLKRASAREFLFQFSLKDRYVPVSAATAFGAAAPGERGVFFYDADHGLGRTQIRIDRLLWLESRLVPDIQT